MTRFPHDEAPLALDANKEFVSLSAQRAKPRRITRLSEARKMAGDMARETDDYVSILWDADAGVYVLKQGMRGKAIEIVRR